jgi:hypothetical protein
MLGMVLIVFVYFLSLPLFVWCMPIWLGYVQHSIERVDSDLKFFRFQKVYAQMFHIHVLLLSEE